jgi:hypothetical protein
MLARMCGSCTIESKIAVLNAEGITIDMNVFISYAMLRMILSSVLCPPFDKWDVNLLRRRYYTNFLSTLRKSEWKAFLPYFTDQAYLVKDYWRIFKE